LEVEEVVELDGGDVDAKVFAGHLDSMLGIDLLSTMPLGEPVHHMGVERAQCFDGFAGGVVEAEEFEFVLEEPVLHRRIDFAFSCSSRDGFVYRIERIGQFKLIEFVVLLRQELLTPFGAELCFAHRYVLRLAVLSAGAFALLRSCGLLRCRLRCLDLTRITASVVHRVDLPLLPNPRGTVIEVRVHVLVVLAEVDVAERFGVVQRALGLEGDEDDAAVAQVRVDRAASRSWQPCL
jgi:hypothetical protein